MAEYVERKYEYREEVKRALEEASRYIDDLFDSLDGSRTAGVDITFRVRPGSIIGVDIKLITNGELLKR